ncbi:MAG: hypothetical protein E7054_07050 [Lentisphaerae bacterium]|nr:hypothetical protein [Lentisphaerota bacterium]
MADERERSNWWHTASLLAMIRNALTTGEAVSPADFHPMEKKKEPEVIHLGKDISVLRDIFFPTPRRKK